MMPALKMLILYRKAELNSALMKDKTLVNTVKANENDMDINTEIYLTYQKLNQLKEMGRQIQSEIESMEKMRATQLYKVKGMN